MGAKQKPIPSSRTVLSTPAPSRPGTTPSASRKSEAPDFEDTARFPCFTTRAPAAAAMIAAVVEILIVWAPSPPVPTVSTARSLIEIGAACAYMTSTRAPTSSEVSPLALSARRKFLTFSISDSPLRISRIALWISSFSRSSPDVSFSVSALQLIEEVDTVESS